MILRLKDVYEFREAHAGAKLAFGDPRRTPTEHFNLLFCRLFGLAELSGDQSPHRIVDAIRGFLRWSTRSVGWIVRRCAKYTWALRRQRMFLRQIVWDRRRRIAQTIDHWEAHEADLDREYETRLQEEVAKRYRQKRNALQTDVKGLQGQRRKGLWQPLHTPRKMKMQVLARLHRQRLHKATEDARHWVLHRQELRAELAVHSRRLADLWLWGSLQCFDDRSTTQLVTQVTGIRKRLQLYGVSPPHVQPLMWHNVTVDELKELELYMASPNDEIVVQVSSARPILERQARTSS